MTKDKIYRVVSVFRLVLLVLLFVLPSLSYASTNVSILYGWNGTNFVPVQITSEGAIKMDINMTQAVGIVPKVNNTYDLGSLSRLWANLYVRSIRGGSGPLSLFANGNEVITILTSGNVGIGTTTPQTRLDVAGAANITGDLLVSNVSILTRQGSDNTTLTSLIGTKVNLTQLGSYETTTAQSADNTTLSNRIGAQETKQSADNTTLSDRFSGTMPAGDNTTLTALLGQKLNLTGGNVSGAINLATSSGNVGIGTTTPEQKLTVIGTANITEGVITPNVTFSDGSMQTSASIGTNVSLLYGMNESSASQPIALRVDSSGALKMAVSSGTGTGWSKSGANVFLNNIGDRVGIGTTTPTTALEVSGHINSTGTLSNSTFSGDVRILGTLYGGSPVKIAGGLNVINGNITFTNGNVISVTEYVIQSGGSTRLFINETTGNVGIGTTNPTFKLDVNGVINASGLLINGTAMTSGSTSLPAANITAGTFGSGLFTFPNGLNITQGGLLVNGNVGIGSAAPASTLEINGTVRITPTATGTCNAAVEGSIFYNITEKHMYMCNSTNWLRLDNTYI